MQKSEDQPSGAVRKAIATLKEQQESRQSYLETTKLLLLGLQDEFKEAESQFLAHKSDFEKKIATAEREIEEAKAAISKLEGMGG